LIFGLNTPSRSVRQVLFLPHISPTNEWSQRCGNERDVTILMTAEHHYNGYDQGDIHKWNGFGWSRIELLALIPCQTP
jgi:hypothetical protein